MVNAPELRKSPLQKCGGESVKVDREALNDTAPLCVLGRSMNTVLYKFVQKNHLTDNAQYFFEIIAMH